MSEDKAEKLGRFHHHPDPAIDYEIEVESLESIWADREMRPIDESFPQRLQRALYFKVGGHVISIEARKSLLEVAEAYRTRHNTFRLAKILAAAGRDAEASAKAHYDEKWWEAYCAALTGLLSGSPDSDCGPKGYAYDATLFADAALAQYKARRES